MKVYLEKRLKQAIDNSPHPTSVVRSSEEISERSIQNITSAPSYPTHTKVSDEQIKKISKDSYVRIRYTDAQRGGTAQYIVFSEERPAPGEKDGDYKVMWIEDNLASALVGKKLGDEVSFELRPGEISSCTVIEIED